LKKKEVTRDNRNSVIPPGASGARGRSSRSSSRALLRVDSHHGLRGGGSEKRREGREDEGREWEEEGREGRGREMMGGGWGREGSDNFWWLTLQGLHFILLHRCLKPKQKSEISHGKWTPPHTTFTVALRIMSK